MYTLEISECPSKHNVGSCENTKIIKPALEKLTRHQTYKPNTLSAWW